MSKATTTESEAAKDPTYTLTVTGSATTLALLVDAVDLLGRLHMGQFDRVQHELAKGVEEVLYAHQDDPGKAEQQTIFLIYLDELMARMRSEERVWQGMRYRLRTRGDTLLGNFHHNTRERVAYALWKKIGNALSVARGFAPRDDYSGTAGGHVSVTVSKVAQK